MIGLVLIADSALRISALEYAAYFRNVEVGIQQQHDWDDLSTSNLTAVASVDTPPPPPSIYFDDLGDEAPGYRNRFERSLPGHVHPADFEYG